MIVTRPIPPPLAQVTIACVESWAESGPGYCNCSWARLLRSNELSLRVGSALVRSSFSRTTPLIFVVTRDECYDWRHERGSQPTSQPSPCFLARGRLLEGRPSTPSDPNEPLRRGGQGATATDNRSGRLGNVGTQPTRPPWGPRPEWRHDAPRLLFRDYDHYIFV
jgi:hypothetical protein